VLYIHFILLKQDNKHSITHLGELYYYYYKALQIRRRYLAYTRLHNKQRYVRNKKLHTVSFYSVSLFLESGHQGEQNLWDRASFGGMGRPDTPCVSMSMIA